MNKPVGKIREGDALYLRGAVLAVKPNIILETGTYYGGGSTYTLVGALAELGKGVLHTYEEHKPFFDVAQAYYDSRADLKKHVVVHNEEIVAAFGSLAQEFYDEVGLVFLDGGDELPSAQPKPCWPAASESLAAFKIMEGKIRSGTHVLLHDWLNNGRGARIRDYLLEVKFAGWEMKHVVDSYEGLCHLVRRK
jgi:predicted O-methyltransferase YrrM